ncbi:hypothetical protein JTE90_012144 [Oedothorax gibbosus]|uniref:Uncharacterized protein n=1 Tax=Oedothorax gibbosus TaxID=931172 RepID=A0AAV6ULR6_9ARAC|nr:hypothetical protein JTE90_012144 [Oedothorax gibbosus]
MIKRVPPSSDPALDLAVLPDSHPAVPAVVQEETVALNNLPLSPHHRVQVSHLRVLLLFNQHLTVHGLVLDE